MSKLLIIPNKNQINDVSKYTDAFLLGIDDLSINMPDYFTLDEIIEIVKKTDKKIFINLNKNIQNKDLENLKKTLIKLNELKIEGIFYYDAAVLNIVKQLNLKLELVWSQEHLTTNYATINFWHDYNVNYTYLSSEITLDEIIEISQNTKSKLIIPIFGYLPIFASKRHTVNNYLERFSLTDNSKINYMNLKNDNYPIVDDKLGTNIYSSNILNGFDEYLKLKEYNIEYVTLNSFNIEDDKFLEVVKMFKEEDKNTNKKMDEMFQNVDKGFLYKETIYKVKKYD